MGSSKRALISVSDKSGIIDFASALQKLGFEIISTGGTYRLLQQSGVAVTNISAVTQFPEILDGRVKTLHPRIHSGLLAVRENEAHRKQLREHDIEPIDLLVVNLYPVAQPIAKPEVSWEEAIENIDIGGPAMLRAAAKNHADVTVVVDQEDYGIVIDQLQTKGEVDPEMRRRLAVKAFRHTAAYDSLIAQYLSEKTEDVLPDKLTITYEKKQDLRYGENPHQQAAFYSEPHPAPDTLASAEQLHGKALSYNNINDANAALAIVKEFSEPAAVAVKHMNPCGVGIGSSASEAFQKAYAADPVSIFGGIVALNRPVDELTAQRLNDIFLEIVLAPDFSPEALEILTRKKNIRLLKLGQFSAARKRVWRYQSVEGGLLVQEEDVRHIGQADCQVVTEREPSPAEWEQLLFGWKVVKHVKSNAIVLANDNQTIGVGAGQMNRVGAAKIAIEQAGEKCQGAILASDAFFPMPDTVQEAAKAGIKAIIQPGGSIRDEDSIVEANKHGMAMVFTGVRHFKH